MGGMVAALGDFASDMFKKSMTSETVEKAWEFTGAKSDIANLHPNAAAVMELDSQVIAKRNEIFSKLEAPSRKLWAGISKDSDLMNAHDYKTATIRDIHSTLVTKGHPLSNETQQILSNNVHPKTGVSLNAKNTLDMQGVQNKLQSERMAADQIFGTHMQNVIPYVQELYESKNPSDKSTADLLIRVIGNDSRDTVESGGHLQSRGATSIRQAFERENKLRTKVGGTPLPLPKTEATYTRQGGLERGMQSFMVNRLAGLAALPHIPMFGNLLSTPMKDIIKGFGSLNDPQIKAMSTAAGILAKTQHSMFVNDLYGRTGLGAKAIGPAPAAFFYKMFHLPMFNMIRFHQLSLASATGYHAATDWAADVVKGSKIAAVRLKEMGLDPAVIAKRGGELTPEEQTTAMFHFVNNRMFIDRPMDRALLANSNAYVRSATMFHSVIMSQYAFMKRELWTMTKTGDIKGLAQFGGTLGILFPMVIPWLNAAEVFGRTLSLKQAKEAKDEDYRGLLHPRSVGDFTSTYVDMLSYLGAFGVFHSLIKSAWGDRLAATAMGPIPGSAITTAQDAWNAATKTTKSGKHNWSPLGRDVSEFTIPIVGKWMGHKFFPTLTEEKEDKISKPQRGRRRR